MQVMEHQRHRMGQVEGAIARTGADLQQGAGLEQLIGAQTTIFAAKNKGDLLAALAAASGAAVPHQPPERTLKGQRRQRFPLTAATGGHNDGAVGHRRGQIGIELRGFKNGPTMNGHLQGLMTQMIAARRHQAQVQAQQRSPEVGAQASHTAHIQRTRRLHEHHSHGQGFNAHTRLWR